MADKVCNRSGCDKPVRTRGLCHSHYNQLLYHEKKAKARKKFNLPFD